MKPILSGYRLALTYSLILTADVPRPRPSNIECARAELQEVLRDWAQGMYPDDSDRKIMVHLFRNLYTEDNLTVEALRGEDANMVSHLRSIAAELGYVIAFANLKYKLIGRAGVGGDEAGGDVDADGDGGAGDDVDREGIGVNKHEEGNGNEDEEVEKDEDEEEDEDDEDEDEDEEDEDEDEDEENEENEEDEDDEDENGDEDRTTSMAEITASLLSISDLVDLDGVQNLKLGQLFLEDKNLIKTYPFDDTDSPPDETAYEGSDLIHCAYETLYLIHFM
jgi:cobalamin biosynthesis protein CobT